MARPKVIYADSHSSLLLAILKIWFYVNLPQKHYEKVKNRLNYLAQQVKFSVSSTQALFQSYKLR